MTGRRRQTIPLGSPTSGKISDGGSSTDQDRFLPIANVSRIMKKSLPANAKISKEAKETVQECVSEYISFITGEASDKCQREKRKTINGDDLLWAMTILGFQNHVGPLRNYLGKYRETEVEKNSTAIQEDQSPTNSNTDHGLDEINTDSTNFMQATADFLRFSSGSIPKSLGSQVGVTGYEENSVNIGASNFNRI